MEGWLDGWKDGWIIGLSSPDCKFIHVGCIRSIHGLAATKTFGKNHRSFEKRLELRKLNIEKEREK